MPNDNQPTPIQIAWVKFVKSVQDLLVVQLDDRSLDQYLQFRDAVLSLVQSDHFLNELNQAWPPTSPSLNVELPQIGDVLVLELEAFPRAVEVAQATQKPEEAKSWWRRTLGRASTTSSSVKDLLPNLPWYANTGITLFKELIDLFKGKE